MALSPDARAPASCAALPAGQSRVHRAHADVALHAAPPGASRAEPDVTERRTRLPDFIVGGTEKAGTTSVFDWLSLHPQVAASSRKETDFFRSGFTGDLEAD